MKARRFTWAPGVLLVILSSCHGSRREAPKSNLRVAEAAETQTRPELPQVTPVSAAQAGSASEVRLPSDQIFEPKDLSAGERRPLLIFLHGLGASGKMAFEQLQLAAFGARERVFVLAPDGIADHEQRQFWNAGEACCNFDHREIDDVARLGALIDVWRAHPGIDANRVYVMGHSNGGFMTQRLACAFADRIAAAASLAGASPPASLPCAQAKSLALLEVHGDADKIVRYEGGRLFDSPVPAPFASAQQGLRDWAKRLGCSGAPESGAALDLEPELPGPETTVDSYAHCASGSVTLWTVHGGTHSVGTGSATFAAVWRFLSAQKL